MNNLTKEQMAVELAYYKDGAEIEARRDTDSSWATCYHPMWMWQTFQYRVKPQAKPTIKIRLYRWLVHLGGINYYITEHSTTEPHVAGPGVWAKRLEDTALEMEVEE